MSKIIPIPRETSRAAQAIFGSNNFYIILGNSLASILSEFKPRRFIGPGWEQKSAIPILSLLTLFQYMERLSDRQTVRALHYRLDWKYALHLPLNHPGIPEEILCQYRQKNLFRCSHLSELQELLERLAGDPALDKYIDKPVDAKSMITAVCTLDRLTRVVDAMHRAIEGLTNHQPDWLRRIALPHWYTRYYHVSSHLKPLISSDRPEAFSREIGEDAQYLLECVEHADTPGLDELEEIRNLHAVWQEQFKLSADASALFLSRCASCPSILTDKTYINA
jgi:hypothetical protein